MWFIVSLKQSVTEHCQMPAEAVWVSSGQSGWRHQPCLRCWDMDRRSWKSGSLAKNVEVLLETYINWAFGKQERCGGCISECSQWTEPDSRRAATQALCCVGFITFALWTAGWCQYLLLNSISLSICNFFQCLQLLYQCLSNYGCEGCYMATSHIHTRTHTQYPPKIALFAFPSITLPSPPPVTVRLSPSLA